MQCAAQAAVIPPVQVAMNPTKPWHSATARQDYLNAHPAEVSSLHAASPRAQVQFPTRAHGPIGPPLASHKSAPFHLYDASPTLDAHNPPRHGC